MISKMRNFIRKLSAVKYNFLVISILAFSVYVLLMYIFIETTYIKSRKIHISSVRLSNVIVHIDLKGTPLKLSYLESLLPMMKKYGANGLLMEYEDMFPYEGKLMNLSAEYHYNKNELKQFLQSAKKSGFDIIPLVQTFGHLEFALKLAEFQHLREDPMYPDSICPSNMETLVLLEDLIRQVIDFHESITPLKYIHIGCDEVFHINQCKLCKERPEIISNKDLLIQHIRSVSEIVNSLSAETVVLIWDDMLRGIKAFEWVDIEPFLNVQPVYWDYGTILQVTHQNLYMYHNKFPHIWIASAYKGADGRTTAIPNFRKRFLNHYRWMRYILGYSFGGENVYDFGGIILTGWSRYSHMDPPCELLPLSIPSLILNLLVVQNFITGIKDYRNEIEIESIESIFHDHISIEFNKSFKCLLDYDSFDFSQCKFEGDKLYSVIIEFNMINAEINSKFNNEDNAIVSLEYYSRLGTLNMNNVLRDKGYLEWKLGEFIHIENQTMVEITKYYDYTFAREYVWYKSLQNKEKIKTLLNILNNSTHARTWSRRTII